MKSPGYEHPRCFSVYLVKYGLHAFYSGRKAPSSGFGTGSFTAPSLGFGTGSFCSRGTCLRMRFARDREIKMSSRQESITGSVYLTHDYVLGLWVNRFAWISWIPRDSMYSMCLIRKTPALFLRGETGNLKINMAEADLSPTTFTSSSASESDYDISLRIPVIIIIRPRKQCKT